jgi:hypothetical protein
MARTAWWCAASRPFGVSDQLPERSAETPQAAEAAAARRLAAFDAVAEGRFGLLVFGCPGVADDCRGHLFVLGCYWRPLWKGCPTAAPRGKARTTDWASVAFRDRGPRFSWRFFLEVSSSLRFPFQTAFAQVLKN